MLGVIIPVGKSVMYMPDGNYKPSGPWTDSDTKFVIVCMILALLLLIIGIVVEKIRGNSIKEALLLDLGGDISAFSIFVCICFYSVWGLSILGYLGFLIYNLI